MRTQPTKNQARRIARAINWNRVHNWGRGVMPEVWASLDQGYDYAWLFIGNKNEPGSLRAETWKEAQELVEAAESGKLSA